MSFIDILYPKKCLECKTPGSYICSLCADKVPKPKLNCPICDKPSIDGITHIKCQKPFGLDGVFSLFSYQGVVRKAIISLKYKFALDVAGELINLSSSTLLKYNFLFNRDQILVPVPLYWYKENFRGFNQSTKLGYEFAKRFEWKFSPDLLIKKFSSKNQSGLNRGERKNNVKGVFAFNSENLSLITPNLSLILFDDVYTTGFTLKEACRILKQKGVKKVWGLTIAK